MSFVEGMYTFMFAPTKTSVARYKGFMFGSESRPRRAARIVCYNLSEIKIIRKYMFEISETSAVSFRVAAGDWF